MDYMISERLKELSHIDNEIMKLNNILHELRKRKRVLDDTIIEYMTSKKIPGFKFDGKIYTNKSVRVPLTKKQKVDRCLDILNDYNNPNNSREPNDNFIKNLLFAKGVEFKNKLIIQPDA